MIDENTTADTENVSDAAIDAVPNKHPARDARTLPVRALGWREIGTEPISPGKLAARSPPAKFASENMG